MPDEKDPKPTTDPQGDTGAGNATAPPASETPPEPGGQVTFTPEQQAHIDKVIGDRLKRDRKKWEDAAEAAKAKAAEDAEVERLKAQSEFKELSEKQAQKLAELEALKPQLEQYEASLTAYLKSAREGLPEYLTPLLDKLNPAEQLEYLAQHGADFKTETTTATIPNTPNAAPEKLSDADRRKRAAKTRDRF